MKSLTRFGSAAALAAAMTVAAAGSASAATRHKETDRAPEPVVFVQTDNPAGNQVVTYDRAGNGTLELADTKDTGGLGGVLSGSVVDHLASQGSLTYDKGHGLLFAVSAGTGPSSTPRAVVRSRSTVLCSITSSRSRVRIGRSVWTLQQPLSSPTRRARSPILPMAPS